MTIRHTNIQLYIQTKYECIWIIYTNQITNNNMKSIVKSAKLVSNVVTITTNANVKKVYTFKSNKLARQYYNDITNVN